MNAHLAEVSTAVDANAHAVVLLDQAGWHTSKKLVVPDNITLMPLPPRAPELNPVENIWQFMRDNWLSNRVFTSYENIVAICCEAWNDLVEQPWKIISGFGTCENGPIGFYDQCKLVLGFDVVALAWAARGVGVLTMQTWLCTSKLFEFPHFFLE